MREIIEDPVYTTYEDMKNDFDNKWILVANCKYDDDDRFIGGIPVAVADSPFEGQRDGFYDEFRDPKYAPRTDIDFNSYPRLYSPYSGELTFKDEVPTPIKTRDNRWIYTFTEGLVVGELKISPNFTIEDIHKIRAYNYERRKDMTFEERKVDIKNGAKTGLERIEQIRQERLVQV